MVTFLDIKKAYDSVPRNVLWEILNNIRVPESFIKILYSMYNHEEIRIKIGNLFSEPFHTKRGLKQGGISSCRLFLLIMDTLLLELRSLKIGVEIEYLDRNSIIRANWGGALAYADDLCLIFDIEETEQIA